MNIEKEFFFQNLKDIVACVSNVEHETLMIREGVLNSDANVDVENAYLILQKLYSLPADVACKS